jgi:hypothetical protein
MQRAAEAKRSGIRLRTIRPDERLVLAFIHPGDVAGVFMDSVLNVIMPECKPNGLFSAGGGYINLQSGPRIAEARSQVLENYLNAAQYKEGEWILCADADMVFNLDDVRTLIAAADPIDRPIVGGLCFAGYSPETMYPTLYRLEEEGGSWAMSKELEYPKNAMVKVGATGAAFLLVHRTALYKIYNAFKTLPNGQLNSYPWFVEGHVDSQGRQLGEDVAFCMRANAVGIPVYVHTGVTIGHRKNIVLTEQVYEDQQLLRRVKSGEYAEEIREQARLEHTESVPV